MKIDKKQITDNNFNIMVERREFFIKNMYENIENIFRSKIFREKN